MAIDWWRRSRSYGLGISIGIKYSDFEDSFIDRVVLKEIKNGNFYVRDGETMWKDATPEQKK